MEDGSKSQNISTSKVGRRLLGENLFVSHRIRFAAKARHAGEPDGKGGYEAAAKDEGHDRCDKGKQAKGSMDANNSWWVRELLAADCQKKWLGWGDTMQRWYKWPYEMKKDEETRMEVEHQKLVSLITTGTDGGTGLAQNHQATGSERRSADSEGCRRRCQALGQM